MSRLITGVNDLGDKKMGKNIETENFVIFCFDTYRMNISKLSL